MLPLETFEGIDSIAFSLLFVALGLILCNDETPHVAEAHAKLLPELKASWCMCMEKIKPNLRESGRVICVSRDAETL